MAIRTRRLRNGKTAYDVELRRPDGTKYSKTFYAKRDAQTWEAEQRADRARDRWIDPTAGRIRLREYADEWMRTRRLAPRTREVYASQLKHIAGAFGDVPLNAITRRAVRGWYAELSERVSPLQAAKCYRLLMAMLNTAAEDDLIAKNRSRVRGAASETSDERPLISVSQALALVEAIDAPYGALLLLAASCGLRLGELLGLTRGDLDFLHRRVIVNKQRQELSSGIQVRRPKSTAGVRDVTMPESIVPLLEAHLERQVALESGCAAVPRAQGRRAACLVLQGVAQGAQGDWRAVRPQAARPPPPGEHDGCEGARHDAEGPHGAPRPILSTGSAPLPPPDRAGRSRNGARHRRRAPTGHGIRRRGAE
ncbi:MAG: Integrase, Lambda phage type [Acidimicrobiales bacterium]|jgi:hypothetical protein|nr:Integrase, Lambda phage type [Acidimicrobiales bacterium]